MNNIVIRNESDLAYTQVANLFIDEYMPQANGSYVKVYLLILRMLSDSKTDISVSEIADILWLTENDVIRSFKYWQKTGLLDIRFNSDGTIRELTINSLTSVHEGNTEKTDVKKENADNSQKPEDIYVRTYTPTEIADIAKDKNFSWVVTIVERYMEQPLSPSDVELIVYLYDNLKFSPDLIFHLYEYCISRDKKTSRYIQTVAIDWAKNNVDTVEKARQYTTRFDANYIDIMKAFGLSKAPAPAQKKYIDTWHFLGFGTDMIKEACGRTILAINEPSFKYANGILEKWHNAGIKTLEDVKTADKLHDSADNTAKRTKTSPKKNSFNSYEQRAYTKDDYAALEQLLSK